MLFPPTQRVIYHENPLVEVVCQFRFPTILKIDAEIPVAFQEAVRSTFPDYTPTVEHTHNVELTDTNGQTDTHTSHITTNHAFISLTEDGGSILRLASSHSRRSITSGGKSFAICLSRPCKP